MQAPPNLDPLNLGKDVWQLVVQDILRVSDLKTLLLFLRSIKGKGLRIMYGPKDGTRLEKTKVNLMFWRNVLQISFPEYAPLYAAIEAQIKGFMMDRDSVRKLACWLTYAHRRVVKWFATTYPTTYEWEEGTTSACAIKRNGTVISSRQFASLIGIGNGMLLDFSTCVQTWNQTREEDRTIDARNAQRLANIFASSRILEELRRLGPEDSDRHKDMLFIDAKPERGVKERYYTCTTFIFDICRSLSHEPNKERLGIQHLNKYQFLVYPMAYDETEKKSALYLGCQMCSISAATHRCTHCSVDMCAECAHEHTAK
jgi:hypothetical protein